MLVKNSEVSRYNNIDKIFQWQLHQSRPCQVDYKAVPIGFAENMIPFIPFIEGSQVRTPVISTRYISFL